MNEQFPQRPGMVINGQFYPGYHDRTGDFVHATGPDDSRRDSSFLIRDGWLTLVQYDLNGDAIYLGEPRKIMSRQE